MIDYLLHFVGGVLIVVACKPYRRAGVVAATLFGVARELWQHPNLHITPHIAVEGALWGIGALAYYAIWRWRSRG